MSRFVRAPNPNCVNRDDDELVELIAVISEDVVDTLSTNLKPGRVQAQVDDAGVRLAQSKDKLTEIAVVGDEYPLLTIRQGEDVNILHVSGIVGSDPGHIMRL